MKREVRVRRVAPSTILVELCDGDGRVGLGEASPLAGRSREGAEACARAIAAGDGAALRDLPAARFALETAELDLEGQRRGVSMAEVLCGAPPIGEVATNALLFAGDPELVPKAEARAGEGYRCIKVKLRGERDEEHLREVRALEALRAALPAVELRVDTNGRWSVDEARVKMERLAAIDVSYVEDPVAWPELARLGATKVRWAADEPLAEGDARERLLRDRACGVFVLKPSMLGLRGAWELGARAQDLGRDVVVTHAFEGPVAMAAAAELALALATRRSVLACGLDPHDRSPYAGFVARQLSSRGRVVPSDRAGLGVEATR